MSRFIRREVKKVTKLGHCTFEVLIEGIYGPRTITTCPEDAKLIESGVEFTVDWSHKGGCWIPNLPMSEVAL